PGCAPTRRQQRRIRPGVRRALIRRASPVSSSARWIHSRRGGSRLRKRSTATRTASNANTPARRGSGCFLIHRWHSWQDEESTNDTNGTNDVIRAIRGSNHLIALQQDGHRAVVVNLDQHVRAEHAQLARHAVLLAEDLREALDERLGD